MNVEIGPGAQKIEASWITVGPYPSESVDNVARWGDEPLPFLDNSVDLVYASHVLEHIIWYKTVDALKEVYRILKPNGKFEVHVPDFAIIVNAYLNKKCGDNWRACNKDADFMLWVNGRIFTYGGPGNNHRAVFDRDYLNKCLRFAGFTKILDKAPIRGNNHGIINLSATGIK